MEFAKSHESKLNWYFGTILLYCINLSYKISEKKPAGYSSRLRFIVRL
jgi:hypothetical protein